MSFKNTEYFAQVLLPSNQRLWQALAFHAGYLNAAGFLACHRFVSHMTGFGAQAGINVGLSQYLYAFEMLLAPIFFITGSTFAGFLVDRKLVSNRRPRIHFGLGTIVFLDLLVLAGGLFGVFGDFGEPLESQRDFILLFILTFCCGLQNGLFVSLTSGQVRTTHITGLCTDIGLNLWNSKARETKKNWLRVKTVVAFFLGSFISAQIFQHVGYWGFLGSTLIAMLIMAHVLMLEDPVEVRA